MPVLFHPVDMAAGIALLHGKSQRSDEAQHCCWLCTTHSPCSPSSLVEASAAALGLASFAALCLHSHWLRCVASFLTLCSHSAFIAHNKVLVLCRWGPASNAAEASPNSPRGSARDASPSTELSICYPEPLVHHYHSSLNQPWNCSGVPYLCSLSGKLSHVHLRSTAYHCTHLLLCTCMHQIYIKSCCA